MLFNHLNKVPPCGQFGRPSKKRENGKSCVILMLVTCPRRIFVLFCLAALFGAPFRPKSRVNGLAYQRRHYVPVLEVLQRPTSDEQ
jgi:hypothetical protein